MAAGSTETFALSTQTLRSLNSELLKPSSDKFWSAEVMATASTGGFWEDDPEEEVKKRVNELKRKFHNGRQLQIKHLPRDVTEEEIRELLSDFPVQSVQLQCGTGSGLARASLEDPEMLEEWDRERMFLLRGQRVPVAPTPTEMMLCVARLPASFTEAKFASLVRGYGEVRRSFLMISEKTGENKGYGFVEYTTKEGALTAKNMLDGKQVENWILCCDWLDSSHVTFESLHSKCLYVDHLPKDFRDMGEFRKVFSSVVNPPYCQIALKNGCPQDWGLVEYSSSEDAETSQTTLNNYNLHGQNIRTCYYIPGVRAINLYLKLLNDSGSKGKAAGLLPDPPAPAVFQQLQNLAKQNPVFAQSLQNIIWSQIQAVQTGGENGKKLGSGAVAQAKAKPPCPPGVPPLGPDNAHAALVILLAAQMQVGSGHPSLLGNPQMLAALQNLVKQDAANAAAAPSPSMVSIQPPMGPAPPPPPPPPPHFQYATSHTVKVPHGNPMKNGYMKTGPPQKVPLLPNPTETMSPPPGEVAPRATFSSPGLEDHTGAGVLGLAPHLQGQIPMQDTSNFWNGLLGQIQNHQQPLALPQLDPNLMVKSSYFDHGGLMGPKSPLHSEKQNGSHFSQQVQPGAPKISHPHVLKPNSGLMNFPENVPGDLQQTINTFLSNAQNLHQLLGTITNAMQTNGNAAGLPPTRSVLQTTPAGYPFVGQPQTLLQAVQGPSPPPQNTWAMSVASATSRSQPIVSVAGAQTARSMMGSPVSAGRSVLGSIPTARPLMGSPVPMPVAAPKSMGFLDMKQSQLRQSPFQNGWAPGAFLTSASPLPAGTPQFGAYPGAGVVPNLWTHPGSPILIASPPQGMVTPIGQKRKYNRLLPSPEPSPEGNYIGQHSQGLGGHYADSYFKRKKKN